MFDSLYLVANTMHWRIIPGAVLVLVHGDEPPSDEDWDACLADVVEHAGQITGMLVYSDKVGPSAHQRARSNTALAAMGKDFLGAIMTGSRMVRGIVTALNWAFDGKVKAFSTKDFDGAVGAFKLDADQVLKVRVTLKQLASSAGIVIEAFADESGQFRQKFNK